MGMAEQGFAVHMITQLFSAALRGIDAHEVEVEVNARESDKPQTFIVGKTLQIRGTLVITRKTPPCSPIPTPGFPRRFRSKDTA